MNTEKLREERSARYGDFDNNSEVSQGLKDMLRLGDEWETMPSFIKEALDMVCVKMSRVVSGDPFYLDNYHDIQGFIDCALDCIEKYGDTYNDGKDKSVEEIRSTLNLVHQKF